MKRQNIFAAIMTLSLSLGQFSQLSVLANENPKLIKNNLFTSNTDQEAIEKAEKALEEAKKELLKAQDDVAKAKQEVTKAETSLVEKRADVTSLEKELENKDKEITQVNLKVEEYEKAYTQKREEYDSLNEKYVLLKNELENAFATLEQIKKECEAIKSNINTLTEEKKNLESEVQTQENTLAQLESETEEVRNQIQKGSLGFFESMGYTDAVRVINEGINKHQSTNLGDENDATSLENMKATLEYIKECNELRKQHGLNELQVNAQLMAIAQVQTNHTSNALGGTGHSQLYNVGENLAYGDPADGYDAFNAWYTKEKAVAEWLESHNMTWDDIKNDTELKTQIAEELGGWNAGFYGPEWVQVGHYKNIVNSSYLGTGFALNTDMRNPVMGQVFSANWSTEYNKGLMSVDAFFEQFDAYYAGLMNAQGRYEEAEEKLASMKADLQKKIDEITAANTELSAKESQKGNAQTAYDTAEGKVTDVEEDIETVENEMDEILNSEENKELANKLNTLKGEKAEILSKIEIAKGDVTKAEGILETAKETLASKEKAVKQAQKTGKENKCD